MQLPRGLIALVLWPLILGALVACGALVPARVPPYISNTPGAYVVVTDRHFKAGAFQLAYPSTWSVVKTSLAIEGGARLAFVAPDGGAVSLLQVDSVGASDEQHLILESGVIIRVIIDEAAEPDANFLALAQQLVSSIRG